MSSSLPEDLEQIRARFTAAWSGPTPPRIEDFLPPPDSPAHLPVLFQLVKIDLERRLRRGDPPTLEDYRRRFPACGDELETWFVQALAAPPDKETDDARILPTQDDSSHTTTSNLLSRMVGEYELLERLGSGGMGEVYKARHRRLNKLVALKLLPANASHPREAAARFQREMKAVGALDHPNVVEAHDAGEQAGIVYLAMKLIDGVDLERLVKTRGPLPIAEACELVRQATLGLHYLHERGLAHRDVKPSNLMRTPDGTVKVLDLGLARWCTEPETGHGLTGLGHALGTPDFLAPEQVENAADADARADLYGLGGTLFYLLTGRVPFAEYKSQYAKLTAHRMEPPPDVRTLRPEVPAELAEIVSRLLAKKPEDRYHTAAQVAAALQPFAEHARSEQLPTEDWKLPPSQGPAGSKTLPQTPKKVAIGLTIGRRSCSLTLAFGAAAVVLVGLSLVWLLEHRVEERHSEKYAEMREAAPPPPRVETEPTRTFALKNKTPEPIQVKQFDLMLTRNKDGRGQSVGRLGERVFDPHLGDTVTVQARLTQPAYAFLIAFRPDGKVDVCFPEKEDERPPLTDQPRYPSVSQGVEYGLTDGVGLQAFAVVISSKPLPAFKEWWSHGKDCPWKTEEAPPGVVYRANGEDPVEASSASGEVRGKGAEVKGKTPVGRLAAWLRKMPNVETVQVLGFAIERKDKD